MARQRTVSCLVVPCLVSGFEDYTLYAAAGAVQVATRTSTWNYVSSFFDAPRAQASIKAGIPKYKDTYSRTWW